MILHLVYEITFNCQFFLSIKSPPIVKNHILQTLEVANCDLKIVNLPPQNHPTITPAKTQYIFKPNLTITNFIPHNLSPATPAKTSNNKTLPAKTSNLYKINSPNRCLSDINPTFIRHIRHLTNENKADKRVVNTSHTRHY